MNNNEQMKLYTEKQVIEAIDKASLPNITILHILEDLTPIELPSDEEMVKILEPHSDEYAGGYYRVVNMIEEQIQGGNNEQQ